MSSINKVFFMGNLTRDPEVRYTPSGTAVGDLSVAGNATSKSRDGKMVETTTFVTFTVWGQTAENCAKYLKKGRSVLIEGKLKFDSWEKDGKKYSKLGVTAENVQFLDSRKAESREPEREPEQDPEDMLF